MPKTATADRVDRDTLLEFLRPRHQAVLLTRRREGGAQLSPVTCGVDAEGRIVVSTYPQRAKAANCGRDPEVSRCVLSPDWNGAGCSWTAGRRCSTCPRRWNRWWS